MTLTVSVDSAPAPALAKLYQKTVTLFFEERFWTMFGILFGAGLALFAINAAANRWWLGRLRFGPVEWVWRSVTYGHRPQMRLAP